MNDFTNNLNAFVSFGEIQKHIENIYLQTGIRTGFRKAVEQLSEAKSYHTCAPEIPDFLSWTLKKDEDLLNLIYQIPIYLSEVLTVIPQVSTDTNQISLPSISPVQISAESYYAPDTLIKIQYFSVIYVLKGNCTLFTAKEHYDMKVGEIALIAPGIPYRVDVLPDNVVLNIISDQKNFEEHFLPLIQKENLISSFFRNALFLSKKEILFFVHPPNTEIRDIIKHLFHEFVSKDPYSTDMFRSYMQIFYTQIIRNHENTYQYYQNNPLIDARNSMPAILQYINKNYLTLSLSMLAKQFHYSPAYLSKIIRQTTGKKYIDIITELKMKDAIKLINETTLTITEIAIQTGYNNTDHFTHAFRQYTGMSPREYRKQIFRK